MLQARGSIAAILPSIAATRSSNERKNGGNGGEDGSNWETLLLAFLLETLRRLGCVQAAQLSESDCFLCYYSLSCLVLLAHTNSRITSVIYDHVRSFFVLLCLQCVGHRPDRTINYAYRCSSKSDALDFDEDRRRCHDFGEFLKMKPCLCTFCGNFHCD
ncbi:hypothetical protein Y032_0151g2843 [Ancylostoma ceylanicum]|uniref:Uncharacterized protein n=1 Tax=Ancylostoma ceylanicum TaxID=53326 RepID=A0A016T1D3_9BILA|nr:hypothetical protein Y032_0151g2843 [Ancylostoma ceylanicum]